MRKMSNFHSKVFVFRGLEHPLFDKDHNDVIIPNNILNYRKEVSSYEIVPGDILEIVKQDTMTCDLILLNGQAVMNESMLTGESVPVIKTPLQYSKSNYNPFEEGR